MMRRVLALAAACASLAAPPPALGPHPRLVLTPARVAALRTAIAADPAGDAAAFSAQLFTHADWVLAQPPQPRGVPDASGVLIHVRTALDYLLTSAAAHALNATGGVYLRRAVAEGLNLAQNWSNWNTVQHALDTGEALLAMGLAYDWLYNDLTVEERAAFVVDGINTRGLAELQKYIGNFTQFWWINNTINWNCVVSSGGIVATLATLGDAGAAPYAWSDVFAPLATGVRPCVGAYNADSSWTEGPGYWSYASKYNIWLFAALQDALGSTLGLTELPGVRAAARFPLYSTGAGALAGTAESYNWADAGVTQEWTPFAMWWGGAPFADAAAAFWSRLGSRLLGPRSLRTAAWGGFVEALAFFSPLGSEADVAALPTAKLYDVIGVGVFRSAWDAPPAAQAFLSFKGGNNSFNHNHLDHSSFVFDTANERFAEDLGADSYQLPEYFGPRRWTYYRLNSLGHNLVLFGNASHAHPVASPVELFNATRTADADGFAIVNVTLALAAHAATARRGFIALPGATAVVIVDEFTYAAGAAGAAANLTWQLHTRATAARAGAGALALTGVRGARAVLTLLPRATACASLAADWALIPLAPLLPDPPYDSAAGLTRVELAAAAPAARGCARIAVALGDAAAVAAAAARGIRPLDEWAAAGPWA